MLSFDRGYEFSYPFTKSRLIYCRACRPRHKDLIPLLPAFLEPHTLTHQRSVQLCLYGLGGLSVLSGQGSPPKHIYEDLKMRIPRYDVTFVSDSRPSRNVTIYDINTYECHSGNMWQALHQRSNCISGFVRFVRTWEAPKHISLVVSETYIMSDHNSRTGLFLDMLHPSDNVTFLKS